MSGRKRHRTASPEESRREDRHKLHRKLENRGENNSSVNETLTKVLTSMDDIKKEFVAWTTQVSAIENQLNQNSSVLQANTDEDCLSVHPPTSPSTFDKVDQLSQGNINAIEAPLAGSERPLADVRSDYGHSNVSKERPDNQVPEQSCKFFNPEDTGSKN
ncbi:Hypothetical predicted protein [Paramuricea clavata]|uniref:Uncharacterized protein n=1 Tax=Paramuricea clavata TaxID=317549 RepID=A0A7D9D637_PARCT|nr:Hypothetical predicted protein [Paramuricea clavata]